MLHHDRDLFLWRTKRKKDDVTMKTKKLASFSSLAGGTLLILAFFRGTTSQLLLIGYFCLWAIIWLVSWMKRPLADHPVQPSFWENLFGADADEEASNASCDTHALLLQHVEARITELLRSVYPQAEWHWCEEDPEEIIESGNVAWITTKNTGEFREATLCFEEPGDLKLEFIQTASLRSMIPCTAELNQARSSAPVLGFAPPPEAAAPPEAHQEPKQEDVQLWYSLIGQKALSEIITELNIRQCSQIAIDPNGQVTFTSADGHPQKGKTLEQMPSPAHWEELKRLLEQQDLEVSIQEDQLSLAW